MAKYYIPQKAQDKLNEFRASLIARVGAHQLTAAKAQEEHLAFLKQWLSEARVETPFGEDRVDVPILCDGCGKVVIVPSDVIDFKCKCSPNVTRYTFKCRRIDLEIGESHLARLIKSNTGRQKLGQIVVPIRR